MSSLNSYLNKKVAVLTSDGRFFVGVLEGYDHSTNLILSDTQERVIVPTEEGESIIDELGLFVIRGDLVVCVGEIDEALDKSIDWTRVHGSTIQKTKKSIR
ncbi:U6 snRNA-associated Sm-like protein LSm8 [Cyberlindnera jadinii]|uniref:LSM2-LSM8 complex subunit LSM8 n=1 Tax=Cyberlindnera jadinii (strain ATCC 18201 / CBS 1600 / BCRC 20928 / JCM 3617 / NBRC 0987 / NRRL Y-1542) TaxID=983966 RepID=A0A0H5BZI6_CYBJN|nr:U6 snRNA-associated Sm-like protein LSm8 [Cyberlindnera jadinii]